MACGAQGQVAQLRFFQQGSMHGEIHQTRSRAPLCALGSQLLLQGLELERLGDEEKREGPGRRAVVLRLRLNSGKVKACHCAQLIYH